MRHLNICTWLPFLIIGMTIQGCCGTKILRCADNEPVAIHKCPEKQYEQYVKTRDSKIKTTIDVLEKLKIADIDLDFKSKVTMLRDTLDQYSGRMQDLIKASFLAINSTPCDKELRKTHQKLLSEFNTESTEIEKLKNTVLIARSKNEDIGALIDEYNSNNGFRTCNRNPTDNYNFYFVVDSDSTATLESFTLPFNDVRKSDKIKSLLKGFLKYVPVNSDNYIKKVVIFRIIDEKKVQTSDHIDSITTGCNTGLIIVPQSVVDLYESEHMAFTFIKSTIK